MIIDTCVGDEKCIQSCSRNSLNEKRPFGTHRYTSEDNIKMELKGMEYKVVDWTHLAQGNTRRGIFWPAKLLLHSKENSRSMEWVCSDWNKHFLRRINAINLPGHRGVLIRNNLTATSVPHNGDTKTIQNVGYLFRIDTTDDPYGGDGFQNVGFVYHINAADRLKIHHSISTCVTYNSIIFTSSLMKIDLSLKNY